MIYIMDYAEYQKPIFRNEYELLHYWRPITEIIWINEGELMPAYPETNPRVRIPANKINSMRPGYMRHMPEGEYWK